MTAWTFAAALVLLVAAYLFFSGFIRTWLRFRGVRVITCPENQKPAAVSVDAMRAAKWQAVAGEKDLHLRSCTRWPEMAACGQECLRQIEESPEACLVKTIVTRWYNGKSCAYCGHAIEKIVWHERPPALRSPDGRTHEWKEIGPEELPNVFATHAAVCWPCHLRESFRREHGELVIERPRPREVHPLLQPSTAVY